MSGEVISVLSLEGRYYNCLEGRYYNCHKVSSSQFWALEQGTGNPGIRKSGNLDFLESRFPA